MKRILVVPLACVVLAVAGCGDDEESDTQSAAPPPTTETTPTDETATDAGGGGTVLQNPADASDLKFEKSSLRAQSGEITIEMENPSSIPHAIAVKGNGVDTDGPTVNKNGTSKITVTLKPGEYEFYCPVGSHEQAGMKGTLTVE